MKWVECVSVCASFSLGHNRPWPLWIACIFCNNSYQFYSKVRSPFQLGCAGFNLICVACAMAVCMVFIWNARATTATKNGRQIGWQAGPDTLLCITSLHARSPNCMCINFYFICKRTIYCTFVHISASERRWMNVMNNGWKKKKRNLFVKQCSPPAACTTKLGPWVGCAFFTFHSLRYHHAQTLRSSSSASAHWCFLFLFPSRQLCWWFSINLFLGIDATMVFGFVLFGVYELRTKQQQQTYELIASSSCTGECFSQFFSLHPI